MQRAFSCSVLIYSETENRIIVSGIIGEIFPSLLMQSKVTRQILTQHTGFKTLIQHYKYSSHPYQIQEVFIFSFVEGWILFGLLNMEVGLRWRNALDVQLKISLY